MKNMMRAIGAVSALILLAACNAAPTAVAEPVAQAANQPRMQPATVTEPVLTPQEQQLAIARQYAGEAALCLDWNPALIPVVGQAMQYQNGINPGHLVLVNAHAVVVTDHGCNRVYIAQGETPVPVPATPFAYIEGRDPRNDQIYYHTMFAVGPAEGGGQLYLTTVTTTPPPGFVAEN